MRACGNRSTPESEIPDTSTQDIDGLRPELSERPDMQKVVVEAVFSIIPYTVIRCYTVEKSYYPSLFLRRGECHRLYPCWP